MEDDRLNSPSTSAVTLELLGHRLQISQDPNSRHLGTTVWDASMVFVKYLERNSRKGRFCAVKLKGKRAVELGAGCGLAGFGMALLGCDVVSTDQVEVLPLLMRNIERNTCWIMQANPDSASFGSIAVAELDWRNKDHIKSLEPPFDYIIGTDVVYAQHLLEPLLQTMLALSGPRTTIMMDYKCRHPSIQLFIMEMKAQSKCEGSTSNGLKLSESNRREVEDRESNAVEENNNIHNEKTLDKEIVGTGELDDWGSRRHGAMAARLLKEVKIM